MSRKFWKVEIVATITTEKLLLLDHDELIGYSSKPWTTGKRVYTMFFWSLSEPTEKLCNVLPDAWIQSSHCIEDPQEVKSVIKEIQQSRERLEAQISIPCFD